MGTGPTVSRPAVSLVKCPDYAPDRVRCAVRDALGLLPAMDGLLRSARRVLLKPNLLSSSDPPERAVNTHPAFVRAVAEYFRERGCKVFIGDSCGSLAPGSTAKAIEITGLTQVAQETGAELVDFDRAPSEEIAVPDHRVLDRVRVPRLLREVDLVVTLPKLKTHGLTLLTGAVKNQLGLVPGKGKKDIHLAAPKPAALAQAMVDIHSVARPQLAIMDAVVGMEGNGPAAGVARTIGLVIAGTDCAAVDAVAAAVVGYRPGEVETTRFAHERGLGEGRIEEIDVLGTALEDAVVADFKKPPLGMSRIAFAVLPNWSVRWVISLLGGEYPIVSNAHCARCGECVANCPTGALQEVNGKIRVRRSRCIGCYCCTEICPEHAVRMTRPLVARSVRALAHLILRR